MVLRYLTGSNRKPSRKEFAEELLDAISTLGNDDYDKLLPILQTYTSEVICSCHDHMGNTLLHLILSRRPGRRSETEIGENVTPSKHIRRTRLRGVSEKGNDDKRKASLLQVVHYLTHCTDADESISDDEAIMGSDKIETPHHDGTTNTSPPVVQQKSAGGSLPLHMACRFLTCSSEREQQQIEIILSLIEAYPVAVQCQDMWGNLPLHEACDAAGNIVPIEFILILLQQYPESIYIRNTDGNLPLHLLAASKAKSYSIVDDNNQNEQMLEQASNEDHLSSKDVLNHQSLQQHEQRQLEIIEYLVNYWPASVHITNYCGQTALQKAELSNGNLLVIEFLVSMMDTVDPTPSENLSTITAGDSESNQLVVDENDISKSINPFDDDCETITLNTTMNTSSRSDDGPDLHFFRNELYDEDESQTEFDGVVELAEDYVEVVVDRIDDDDDEAERHNELFGSTKNDYYYNSYLNTMPNSIDESVDRFISPFGL